VRIPAGDDKNAAAELPGERADVAQRSGAEDNSRRSGKFKAHLSIYDLRFCDGRVGSIINRKS
jgi:hypothetical protein